MLKTVTSQRSDRFIFTNSKPLRPDEPDEQIAGYNGSHGKGEADFHELAGGYGVALFFQNTYGCNVGGGADGGEVSAEGCAG